MKPNLAIQAFLGLYILIFFLYLFGPLVIMSVTAFNSAEFPAITPWECFSFRWFNEGKIAYDGQRLAGLVTDRPLHEGIISSLIIAAGVVTFAAIFARGNPDDFATNGTVRDERGFTSRTYKSSP